SIEEARREIPRNTQAINDYQEHSLQATKEIADSYLESQKEIIKSFQSTWLPYVDNVYGTLWSNWASPRRAVEIYARTVSNIADKTFYWFQYLYHNYSECLVLSTWVWINPFKK